MTKDDTEWSESKKDRAERIDQMLEYMVLKSAFKSAEKGEAPKPLTQDEIADFCGCDRKTIINAERSGLEKLKSQLWEYDL